MAAPRPAPLVNFLVAGVQKGGTTALFDYLGDYGDVALPSEKELHFFDDEGQDWSHPDYDGYHARFPQVPDGVAGRPAGEATPIYAYWPKSLERIAAYNPAMKLILVLRDPVERAWSHWRMETARGVETNPFGWCVREGRRRLLDAEPWGHHREFSYVERGFYGEQMERALGLFARDQVLVLASDALRADHGAALAQVRGFLGLDGAPTPAARESHVGPEAGAPDAADVTFLRHVYAADAERLAASTGIRFG
ncbi:sulfotransferase domain-containing protein [Phenylobacterium sp.]|uniref:sulfotransferase domain-containing protein n=1 Tax=Phenylobacterium sp. TaxID=1871053 RepID=UPI0025DE0B11|nr:sulfotransferase domain-containing protein [Phenylobacterium sp.]MBX3482748.1 sulfotransferase domain-containing protein [Phenylobacterium sp.]MCW5759237.1 sulfotransferase domain-containing protein [Phenylobacterium sp.]